MYGSPLAFDTHGQHCHFRPTGLTIMSRAQRGCSIADQNKLVVFWKTFAWMCNILAARPASNSR
jgi:hypothetical protein